MELALCNTNLCVTYAISLFFSNKTEKYLVLTDQPNIEKFFNFLPLNNVDIYYLPSSYKIFSFDLYKAKKYIKELLLNNSIRKVHIFHQAYGGFYNWIVYAANKLHIEIEYNRVLKDQQYPPANKSLHVLKEKIKYAYLFKTDVHILDRGNKTLMPKLSKAFYRKNNVCEVAIKVNTDVVDNVSKFIIKRLNIELTSSSVILLTGSVVGTNQVSKEEYEIKTRKLIEYIGSKNIVCKCHPRFSDETDEEKELPHIPSFVPLEFLLPYYNTFIGYNSTILNQATSLGKTAISLIDYYTPVSVERRDRWHSYLSQNVLFIKNINEIKL